MKIKIGDVFEIKTTKGKAYLHYVLKEDNIGDLIRVLPGLYSERPTDFEQLVSLKEKYVVSFPVTFAFKRKLIECVASCPLENFTKPPYMRTEHNVRGEFLGWHIIDTQTLKRQLVPNLTTEQKQLSPWGIWNDTLLKEKLAEDWRLEDWG